MPGQSGEAAGGVRTRSLEFHKDLGDERVLPLNELIHAFNFFEENENWERKTAPEMDISDFLTHEENLHWGAIEYEFRDPGSNHAEISFYLRYSPWMYHRKNNILKGRVILAKDMSKYESLDNLSFKSGAAVYSVNYEGKEILSFELYKEYDESFVKRNINFIDEKLGLI